MRLAFRACVFHSWRWPFSGRDHFNVETVRLLDDALPGKKPAFRLEGEGIDLASEPPERHAQLNAPGIDRLAATRGIDAELRFLPGFEDRDLDREIAIPEDTPPLGPFSASLPLPPCSAGAEPDPQAASGTASARCRDHGCKTTGSHCTSSPATAASKRPVSRSIWDKMSR